MTSSVVYSFNQALERVFPERRIYVRSDARTRYFTLSPMSQTGAALLMAGFLSWTALTSVAFVS